VTCKGAIARLRLFPTPGELTSLYPQDIVQGWRSIMKRQPGFRKARLLSELAKESIGSQTALDAYTFHL